MALLICQLLTGSYPPRGYLPVSQFKFRRSIPVVAVFLRHIINRVMYRTEEASDPLNNKLVRQSLPSFSTIVGMGNRVWVFPISSCVTDVPVHQSSFKVQGVSLNWAYFLAKNYVSKQFAN